MVEKDSHLIQSVALTTRAWCLLKLERGFSESDKGIEGNEIRKQGLTPPDEYKNKFHERC